ncbi:hypothetical protein CDL15_Pgr001387 [Punica granatum]|uniref:Anaphase-promoting complex subunit 5 n=1 Tax=Punica granatum TaxID=22663 RepID=A0A218WL10_PUNGR|nr:hypothetical protein CDL15_Pgr001387 [Punica granatum]
MAGIIQAPEVFGITPHKVSVCVLLQVYAGPNRACVPYPFSTVSQHNRLGLFLLAHTKSCDDIVDPKLEDLISQLRTIFSSSADWLLDHLTSRLSSLSSPDDLFNFFADMRGILAGFYDGVVEDGQIILDPNSILGIFLRRCILAFNLLPFEGICHVLTNIDFYCKEVLSGCASYEAALDDSGHDLEATSDYENMDLEKLVYEKVTEEIEAKRRAGEKIPFHLHTPTTLIGLVEDFNISAKAKFKESSKAKEASPYAFCVDDSLKDMDGVFLRSNWQIQGFLAEQADAIEKRGSSFSLNAFELMLRQLEKLAPELHRVHFLRYLNSLYHDDYTAALENLHKYFDSSAGTEGLDVASPCVINNHGRFEVALLCQGMLHFHFGHPKQALEVLAEAVQVSQQHHNDSCLAYTLAAICNLLSEIGISSTSPLLRSSYSPIARMGTSFSVQQQLFVLLRGSLKRAESLKLKRLVASNHLTLAKFHLMHVQRPLLSFGPKALMKLKTCPINVCKELRLSSSLITEFGSENSVMTTDGAQSTAWLKNLQKPIGSSVFLEETISGNRPYASSFFAQPSSIPGSVLQHIGSLQLVRATAWEIYGSAPLARINTLAFANCFADHSSSADAALAYGKLIVYLATYKGYKAAFAALKIAEDRFLSVSKSQMLTVKLQLLHEHALHRGQLKVAQQVSNELGVMASPVTGVDMDLKTEASLRHARTLLAAKQFSKAAAVAHSLFCMCYKFNLHVHNASVLLLLAEIHKKSGNAVLGLPYALASLSFCQSLNLDLLKASATLTLAELWLCLGTNHAKRALALIHSALPMILGHGGLELRARACIAEAKCYLSDPSFSVSKDPEMVLDSLRQATEELQLLEYHELAAEAFYLMAITYDKLGRFEEREEAAASFRSHIKALGNPQDEVNHEPM